ncbi:hypothetical protein ACWGJB_00160 [Streptomyces sp. NPDC054813]
MPASKGHALRLEATTGLPADCLTPWFRMALSSPVPEAEALRRRRLVRLSNPEELARRCPRTATALPYHCAAAAAPIVTGTQAWSTLLLLCHRRVQQPMGPPAAPSRSGWSGDGRSL